VLAAGQGLPNAVLRFADRIETGVPGRLAFDSVPANLRDRPTLSVLLDAAGGKQSVELVLPDRRTVLESRLRRQPFRRRQGAWT
jgi:hypothetical protein